MIFKLGLEYHSRTVIAPNGNIITGGKNKSDDFISIFNADGKHLKSFSVEKEIGAIAILPNNSIAVSTHFSEFSLYLFTEEGHLIYKVVQNFPIDAIAVLTNGNMVIGNHTNPNGKLRIVDSKNGEIIKTLVGISPLRNFSCLVQVLCQKTGTRTISVLKDGRIVYLGALVDGYPQLLIYNTEGKLSKTYQLPSTVVVHAITLLSNGLLAIGGYRLRNYSSAEPGSICVFNPDSGKIIKRFRVGVIVKINSAKRKQSSSLC